MTLWWLSFVDDRVSARTPRHQQIPGTGGFLGVSIVEGPTFIQAVTRAHQLGCNPGGQVKGWPTDQPRHPYWVGHLLTIVDVTQIEAEDAGFSPGEVAWHIGREMWIRTR